MGSAMLEDRCLAIESELVWPNVYHRDVYAMGGLKANWVKCYEPPSHRLYFGVPAGRCARVDSLLSDLNLLSQSFCICSHGAMSRNKQKPILPSAYRTVGDMRLHGVNIKAYCDKCRNTFRVDLVALIMV